MVAIGALMSCVAVGTMVSLAVFLQPITQATGWSRTGVSGAMYIGSFAIGLGAAAIALAFPPALARAATQLRGA